MGAARSKNRERRERLAKIDYSDSDSDSSSAERPLKKPGAVRKARKRPVAKAVATPVVPASMPNPIARPTEQEARPGVLVDKPQLVDDQKCSTPTDESIITSDKQKKKLEKELKSKQKEIAKAEKKEKEKEEKEAKAKAKEEKKKEKLEKKSAA